MDEWTFLDEVDILPKFPENFEEAVASKKWQERKEALEALKTLLDANKRLSTKASYGPLVGTLEQVLAKDANIMVAAVAAQCVTGLAQGLRTKFSDHAKQLLPVIFERFKEKKAQLKTPMVECLDAAAGSLTSLENVVDELDAALQNKNPSVKAQTDVFLFRALGKVAADKAPKKLLKAVGPHLLKHASDSDPEVRDAACQAIGAIHRLVGDKLTKTIIGGELDDAKQKRVLESSAQAASDFDAQAPAPAPTKAAPASARSEAINSASPEPPAAVPTTSTPVQVEQPKTRKPPAAQEIDEWTFLDEVDILPKFPENFEEAVASKKWQERKEALEALKTLLDANKRLSTKASYGPLVGTLEQVLAKDANIMVAAIAAQCVAGLAQGLRTKFSDYAKQLLPVIFERFKEKKAQLKVPMIECLDAAAGSLTSLENVIDELDAALQNKNPSVKAQTDVFLFRALGKVAADKAPKKLLKAVGPHLLKHAGDSDPEVRDAACQAIGAIQRIVGEKLTKTIIGGELDEAKQKKVSESAAQAAADYAVFAPNAEPAAPAPPPAASAPPQNQQNAAKRPTPKKPAAAAEDDDEPEPETRAPAQAAGKKPTGAATQPKVEEPPAAKEQILLAGGDAKQQRFREEKAMRLLKWQFATPTDEHVAQLQQQIGERAKAPFVASLFSKDFKQHVAACDQFQALLGDDPQAVLDNSDLILKWTTLRFFETNPQSLNKVLETVAQMLSVFEQTRSPLHDIELASFVPSLLTKFGDAKDSVRRAVHDIVQSLTNLTAPTKLVPHLLDGLKSKTAKQRAEILLVLNDYLANGGVASFVSQGVIKQCALFVADKDQNVRNAAINALVSAYRDIGDGIWKETGQMAAKERAMVEERIKRSGTVPGSAVRPSRSTSRPRAAGGGAKIVAPVKVPVVTAGGARGGMAAENTDEEEDDDDDDDDAEEGGGRQRGRLNHTFTSANRGGPVQNGPFRLNADWYGAEDMTPVKRGGRRAAAASASQATRLDEVIAAALQAPPAPPPTSYGGHHSLRRTGSASSLSSVSSVDATLQLDRSISLVASTHQPDAITAIGQVLHVFEQPAQRQLVVERISALALATADQITHLRVTQFSDPARLPAAAELLRTACNMWSTMVSAGAEALVYLSGTAMGSLFHAFLSVLADPRMDNSENSNLSRRAISMVTVRICSAADGGHTLEALVHVIEKIFAENARRPHGGDVAIPLAPVCNMTTKCLMKLAETLAQRVVRSQYTARGESALRLYSDLLDKWYEKVQRQWPPAPVQQQNDQQPQQQSHSPRDVLDAADLCIEKVVLATEDGCAAIVTRLTGIHPHLLDHINRVRASLAGARGRPDWATHPLQAPPGGSAANRPPIPGLVELPRPSTGVTALLGARAAATNGGGRGGGHALAAGAGRGGSAAGGATTCALRSCPKCNGQEHLLAREAPRPPYTRATLEQLLCWHVDYLEIESFLGRVADVLLTSQPDLVAHLPAIIDAATPLARDYGQNYLLPWLDYRAGRAAAAPALPQQASRADLARSFDEVRLFLADLAPMHPHLTSTIANPTQPPLSSRQEASPTTGHDGTFTMGEENGGALPGAPISTAGANANALQQAQQRKKRTTNLNMSEINAFRAKLSSIGGGQP